MPRATHKFGCDYIRVHHSSFVFNNFRSCNKTLEKLNLWKLLSETKKWLFGLNFFFSFNDWRCRLLTIALIIKFVLLGKTKG